MPGSSDEDGDSLTFAWDLDNNGSETYAGRPVTETTSFALEGFYTLTFGVNDKDGGAGTDAVLIEVPNRPPECDGAGPSIDTLWPPNHEFADVEVLGVTDPEGDPVTISIDSVYQDEPVNGKGDGDTEPDAEGVGTSVASVRAERAGGGDGRVYHITFTADDGHGGSCSTEVLVSVDKSQGKKGEAVDDGALYDSTLTP